MISIGSNAIIGGLAGVDTKRSGGIGFLFEWSVREPVSLLQMLPVDAPVLKRDYA